mmetsp:Transcript_37332/g.57305  ORF Transcript_37332/g.57305 Transcript_37332/m.57305 type:complete len:310 (+) Transcript_37332:107-1036(+)|eukprot:CAMPEP_0118708056 /NCGR_PEP_ID=MMETSP0800-20121206/21628_1 /TAXON_ID=210618 ORGANISM="Striatella unipunctata, Strain CCMP2910" /NCGR_SAMPLE_ID=MMETSP0800 /ASSEMBLY_ACC=CAM_ASM_000638 /LENGTH=309 /DNA_ID=CAMNT_0006611113 /DNA_START=67 /DNA_END=996 /DNA_ORIENTATION=-
MSAIAKNQKRKGETLLEEAVRTLNKTAWFASSKERNQEDAAELYEKAANAFKVGGLYGEAGSAYTKAAGIYRDKLKNLNEASKALSNAGSCYKKSSPPKAVKAYRTAVEILSDAGRLTQAAKLSKECGELFENELATAENSTNLAIESYQQAAELFSLEDAKSQESQCLAKVAELCSAALDPPDLMRAAQIYENLGRRCLETNLLKYNAKGYFLQCILCHLANGDSVAASQGLGKFGSLDYTLDESREGKFARHLVECVESMDSEGFATACFEYDRITKLDPWKTSLLVKVKRTIEDQDDEDDEDVDLT